MGLFQSSTLFKSYKRSLQEFESHSLSIEYLESMMDKLGQSKEGESKEDNLQHLVVHTILLLLKLNPSLKQSIELEINRQEIESDRTLVKRRLSVLRQRWNQNKLQMQEDRQQLEDFILEIIHSCTKSIGSSSVPQYKVANVELAKQSLSFPHKERIEELERLLKEDTQTRKDVSESRFSNEDKSQILNELDVTKKEYEKELSDLRKKMLESRHQSTLVANKIRNYDSLKTNSNRVGWYNLHRNMMPILRDPLLKSKMDELESIKLNAAQLPPDKMNERKKKLLNESFVIIKKSMDKEEQDLLSSVSDMSSLYTTLKEVNQYLTLYKDPIRIRKNLKTKLLLLEILVLLGESEHISPDVLYSSVPISRESMQSHLEILNEWINHPRESLRQIVQQEQKRLEDALSPQGSNT
jgi:hypothetical protein